MSPPCKNSYGRWAAWMLVLTSAGVQAVKTPTGVQTPTDAAPQASGAPSPAGCEDASDAEEDAALALRFGFHI